MRSIFKWGLVVIGAIFLIFILIIFSNSGVPNAFDGRRQSDIVSFAIPLRLYADDHNGIFPESLEQLTPKYVKEIPVDPKTKEPYEYRLMNNGKSFEICAKLDKGGKKCINELSSWVSY